MRQKGREEEEEEGEKAEEDQEKGREELQRKRHGHDMTGMAQDAILILYPSAPASACALSLKEG